MPFTIVQHEPTARPVITSGRAADPEFAAKVEEVQPLVKDAIALPSDKALPVVVPTGEVADLVKALRAAGEAANVTIRFKRFPRLNDAGEQLYSVPAEGSEEKPKPLSDPWEFTSKRHDKARVTFWTTKKIARKSKTAPTAEEIAKNTAEDDAADKATAD